MTTYLQDSHLHKIYNLLIIIVYGVNLIFLYKIINNDDNYYYNYVNSIHLLTICTANLIF